MTGPRLSGWLVGIFPAVSELVALHLNAATGHRSTPDGQPSQVIGRLSGDLMDRSLTFRVRSSADFPVTYCDRSLTFRVRLLTDSSVTYCDRSLTFRVRSLTDSPVTYCDRSLTELWRSGAALPPASALVNPYSGELFAGWWKGGR